MNTNTLHSSNNIFERWKKGDERAFEQLFNDLHPPLLKFANKILKNDGLAEELVMDVFFKIWNKKNTIIIQGSVDHYLYKCVKYGIIDHYRKKTFDFQSITAENTNAYAQPPCDGIMVAKELEKKYHYAISQLSPKRKQVYQLSRMDGMSNKEIASHTGLSINTVENHITAALKFLKIHF